MINKTFIFSAIFFGVAAGLACFSFFYILKVNDAMPLGTRRNIGMVFMWIGMALAVYRYWKSQRQPLNFLVVLMLCLITMGIASVVDGLMVVSYVKYIEPSMLSDFIVQLKRLALQDQTAMKREFGNQENGGMINYDEFLKQIDQISLDSIFWNNFSLLRMVFHLLYSALISIGFRRLSIQ
ncbi:MAG: DUF4199 family protein [Siphonobacter sp.]